MHKTQNHNYLNSKPTGKVKHVASYVLFSAGDPVSTSQMPNKLSEQQTSDLRANAHLGRNQDKEKSVPKRSAHPRPDVHFVISFPF